MINRLDSLLKDNKIEIVQNRSRYKELSYRFSLPSSEARFIDFNRTGVYLPNQEVRIGLRARFLTEVESLQGKRKTFFALPVRGRKDTNFYAENGEVRFKDDVFGHVEEIELDTCDMSYMRGPTKLNMNSRRRGNCSGCLACIHNYKNLYDETVLKDTKELKTEEDIKLFFEDLERVGVNVSQLEQIAVVTGLFHGEAKVVDHMQKVQRVAGDKGFNGELMYFGCEVNSEGALRQLADLRNFTLIYAIDNFSKRKQILAGEKARINLEKARETLQRAKEKDIQTTYAYIAGIDELETMKRGAERLMDTITRFPIVNIYQVQTPGQISVMTPFAKTLEYYLHSRKIFERIFEGTDFKPRRWENYRPLWYDLFKGQPLTDY